jgi:hypothetical protein
MPETRLSLDQDGDQYRLVRRNEDGSETEMLLSETDVMSLAQSAALLVRTVVSKRNQESPGLNAALISEARNIGLNSDHHKSELHLEIIPANGPKMIFAFQMPLARSLAARLPTYLDELDLASKKDRMR